MTSRIRLVHLTAVGSAVDPASVTFGERLTVIHGASDTGKSHILDLLNYVLGVTRSIEMPPEGRGYQYVHLGLRTTDGLTVTLVRDMAGGKVGLIEGDVRQVVSEPALEYLHPGHVSKDPKSLSRYLLSLCDLDGQMVRRNQNNETRMLEWRDVMRLVAVGEEAILAKRSPIEFGQYTDRPVEAAIFRMFIEGSDDSGLTPIPKIAELKRVSASKLEVLDHLIGDLEQELSGAPSEEAVGDQLVRINVSIASASEAVEERTARRDGLVLERAARNGELAALRVRDNELADLEARFELLRRQYDSDLDRLEMISQAVETFVVDYEGSCPFCGSAPEHQHWPEVPFEVADTGAYEAAIVGERAKIVSLRTNLSATIDAVTAERRLVASSAAALNDEMSRITEEIRMLEGQVISPGQELSTFLNVRSTLERLRDAHGRLREFEALRATLAKVDRPKTSTEVPIAHSDLHGFEQVAQDVLRDWLFSSESTVSYSSIDRDLVVDGRPRRTRGKGVRSVLRALFNVSLAQYCLETDKPHPGFTVLDSPIVTYRQPGEPELSGEDETVVANVVDAFYSHLQNRFAGQAIILENKSPLSPLPHGSEAHFFGGPIDGAFRSGFYPASDGA